VHSIEPIRRVTMSTTPHVETEDVPSLFEPGGADYQLLQAATAPHG
jgi:hypothetical protein